MNIEKFSVVIIGGGIAGLSVAKFLAERGIDFLLLEEHKEFFKKPCGEGITQKITGYDFYDLYGSKKGIEKEIFETCIYTKYGEIIVEMPTLMTDKKKIEEELARKAMKQGEIRMGEKVERIENGVLFPQKIKAKLIVGADGVFSLVRNYIRGKSPECGIGVVGYTKDVEKDADKCHVIIKNGVAKYGYAWYFPKKDKWNIGIGSFKKKYFKNDFKRFKVKHESLKWRGAYIPLDKPVKSYGKNAILIGDSASHIFANTGAGILPSMICACLATEFIEKCARKNFYDVPLYLYEKKWKKFLGKPLKHTYYMKNLLFNIGRNEYIRHKLIQKYAKELSKFYRKIA